MKLKIKESKCWQIAKYEEQSVNSSSTYQNIDLMTKILQIALINQIRKLNQNNNSMSNVSKLKDKQDKNLSDEQAKIFSNLHVMKNYARRVSKIKDDK